MVQHHLYSFRQARWRRFRVVDWSLLTSRRHLGDPFGCWTTSRASIGNNCAAGLRSQFSTSGWWLLGRLIGICHVREQGEQVAETSRITALTELMETAGLSLQEGADVVADVVNAMVVRCAVCLVWLGSVDCANLLTSRQVFRSFAVGRARKNFF